MAINLKLVKLIRDNRLKLTRTEMIEQLKKDGHSEQDIMDSYEEVVKKVDKRADVLAGQKPCWVAVVLSVFFPGVGHIYLGQTGIGITILILYVVGYLLIATIVGMIIGIPLIIATWLWGLIGSIKKCDTINKGEV